MEARVQPQMTYTFACVAAPSARLQLLIYSFEDFLAAALAIPSYAYTRGRTINQRRAGKAAVAVAVASIPIDNQLRQRANEPRSDA